VPTVRAAALLVLLAAAGCGRPLVGAARDDAAAEGGRAGCVAQVAGVYDSVFAARRADGAVWIAPDHARFVEVTRDGRSLGARDLVLAGSSAYGTAAGCAIIPSGEVVCFPVAGPIIHSGELGAGLGDDVTTTGVVPVRLAPRSDELGGLPGAVQLAASMNGAGASFCAVLGVGRVFCWGYGGDGILGTGSDADASYAQPVRQRGGAPFEGVAEVRLGERSACARTVDGAVWCWGDNHLGQLGVVDPMIDGDLFPRRVELPARATRLATEPGDTFCAILEDDRVACWGWNAYAQAGAADSISAVPPTIVAGSAAGEPLRGAFDLAPDHGMRAMCANTRTRGLVCWGQLFLGPRLEETPSPFAVDVPGVGPGVVTAPLSSFGARDGALLWVDGAGRVAVGSGGGPLAFQPPCP
jgi:hypothetical protein